MTMYHKYNVCVAMKTVTMLCIRDFTTHPSSVESTYLHWPTTSAIVHRDLKDIDEYPPAVYQSLYRSSSSHSTIFSFSLYNSPDAKNPRQDLCFCNLTDVVVLSLNIGLTA